MRQNKTFSILDIVDSTNNYAMQQIHAGLAISGDAWCANEQWGGKGQRSKTWVSQKGQNVLLSIALLPNKGIVTHPFLLSMLVANTVVTVLQSMGIVQLSIKWPNDIYIGDRKAGGILIENVYKGNHWQWAIIGIGLNINQTAFETLAHKATSLRLVTGLTYDVYNIAKLLSQQIDEQHALYTTLLQETEVQRYNQQLFKKGETVQLKKQNALFNTVIKAVNEYGQLLTTDVIDRTFAVGEVEWQHNVAESLI